MTEPQFTTRDKAGYSLKRRLRTLLKGLFGTHPQKTQDLRFITINGHRFKRIILRDSFLAAQIEGWLEGFGSSEYFPRFVTRYENEIWVDFVDGQPLPEVDEQVVAKVADFYGAVYTRRSRLVAAAELPVIGRMQNRLYFLKRTGFLADDVHRRLEAFADRMAPERFWVGFDYADPVLKNFVITGKNARLCAIDVECLSDDQPIGSGVAMAGFHWLEPFQDVFFDRLARHEVPDFRSYFPFIQLYVATDWMKTHLVTGKRKFLDPALFDRFR